MLQFVSEARRVYVSKWSTLLAVDHYITTQKTNEIHPESPRKLLAERRTKGKGIRAHLAACGRSTQSVRLKVVHVAIQRASIKN